MRVLERSFPAHALARRRNSSASACRARRCASPHHTKHNNIKIWKPALKRAESCPRNWRNSLVNIARACFGARRRRASRCARTATTTNQRGVLPDAKCTCFFRLVVARRRRILSFESSLHKRTTIATQGRHWLVLVLRAQVCQLCVRFCRCAVLSMRSAVASRLYRARLVGAQQEDQVASHAQVLALSRRPHLSRRRSRPSCPSRQHAEQ